MSVAAVAPVVDEQPVVVLLQQGIALYRQGDMPGAEDIFTRVLLADHGNPHALHILGLICHKRGDLEMAERLVWRSIQCQPHSRAYLNLGVIRQHRGANNAAIAAYRRAIDLEPDYAEAWVNLLFALDMHALAPPSVLKETRQAFDATCCARLTAAAPPYANDRDPNRRLRVGYVSGDFRMGHSAAMAFAWIAQHDPAAVEVFLYSTYERDTPTAQPFKDRADVWCEIGHLAPHELAEVVREDRIDILVDLSGVSQGGRPLTFALKPAPVQVGGWGYSSGLGIAAMDYLVGDPVAMPPGAAALYPERLLELPCVLAYLPGTPAPALRPRPVRDHRVYGYLGRPIKLCDATLATWAKILRRDQTGRLVLKSDQYADRTMREWVTDTLGALGVGMERVEIRDRITSREEHLLAHYDIDVALDSFPQTGGMTTCDALLMGVPVVTIAGTTVPQRTSASILGQAGLRSWVTDTPGAYVAWALSPTLPDRQRVRDGLLGSILCQPERYARIVEERYREAWRRWCAEAA